MRLPVFRSATRASYAIRLLPLRCRPDAPAAILRIGALLKAQTSARLGVNPPLGLAPALQPRQPFCAFAPGRTTRSRRNRSAYGQFFKAPESADNAGYASEMIKMEKRYKPKLRRPRERRYCSVGGGGIFPSKS
jgi:hypothetical protein